jgi:hypothetical protein
MKTEKVKIKTEKEAVKHKENFIGFNTNAENREKALSMKSLSPDLNKMLGIQVDSKTTLYFKKTMSKEKIKERIELYIGRKNIILD